MFRESRPFGRVFVSPLWQRTLSKGYPTSRNVREGKKDTAERPVTVANPSAAAVAASRDRDEHRVGREGERKGETRYDFLFSSLPPSLFFSRSFSWSTNVELTLPTLRRRASTMKASLSSRSQARHGRLAARERPLSEYRRDGQTRCPAGLLRASALDATRSVLFSFFFLDLLCRLK